VGAVGGVSVRPTVGSAAVVGAVAGLVLHCCNLGGQLCLSGVGRGLNAGHGQCVFRRGWNGCRWLKRRSGNDGCGVAGLISRLAGSCE